MNSKKTPTVIIIGCGWLGKKLGVSLTSQNYTVYGTTRSSSNFSSLSELKIKPVKFVLPVQNSTTIHLPAADTAVISISPGRGSERQSYINNISQVAQYLSEQDTKVILYSSTSVYNGHKSELIETDADPDKSSENVILAAEAALLEHCPDAVILRLCGLYGEERHPATFMAGRKNIADGDAPVNLIHSDDVIQITEKVIGGKVKGEIFNACSGNHPAKKDIYTSVAERLNLKKPQFLDGGENSKKISSEKLIKKLKVKFKHPDPADFLS